MSMRKYWTAGLLGLALSTTAMTEVYAQNLRIMEGAPTSALSVPMNRAVVLESDVPFGEVSIANPGIADISTLSDKTIYVLGKAPGRTSLTLLSPDGKLISNVEVQVAPDVGEFKERLRQILPGEAIEVRTANDGIVLSGTVSSTAKLDRALDLAERYAPERVSNLMSVGGTQQVMLKVRFAEMNRNVAKELSASVQLGNGGYYGETGGYKGVGNAQANADDGQVVGPTLRAGSFGAFTFGGDVAGLGINVLLEAYENSGMVRTLAEPNLTALSGQEAKFLAGGEYPIPVADDDGLKIEYKPFGVEMNFTPVVVDGDIINLTINAAVSSLDATSSISTTNGISISGFKRRETSTTVEMRDGESFAIAGLLQDDFRDLKGQVPWLGDVPVLGALFRSSDYERKQSELVIIVTPHLVTPTRGEALALPTDRVRIPTEAELFGMGITSTAANAGAKEVARQDYTGSYGYVME